MHRKIPTSALVLIGSNLLPVVGVLCWGWSVLEILFLYWAETVVIGFFALLKMLVAKEEHTKWPMMILIMVGRLVALVFFVAHFGGFIAGIGFVLYSVAQEFLKVTVQPLALLSTTWVALATIALSHGYSFVVNFLIKGERLIGKGRDPVIAAYGRVIVLHLTLAFGMGPLIYFGHPLYLLLVFIVLKLAADLWGHLRERRRFAVSDGLESDLEVKGGDEP